MDGRKPRLDDVVVPALHGRADRARRGDRRARVSLGLSSAAARSPAGPLLILVVLYGDRDGVQAPRPLARRRRLRVRVGDRVGDRSSARSSRGSAGCRAPRRSARSASRASCSSCSCSAAAIDDMRRFKFPFIASIAVFVGWFFVIDLLSGGGNWTACVTLFVGLVYLARRRRRATARRRSGCTSRPAC